MTLNSVLVNLHRILKVGDSATGKLAEKIKEHFSRLSSSIDVILLRRSLDAEYDVVKDVGEDAQGNVVVTSNPLNEYFAAHPEYVEAVNRIKGMNNRNRSGDIVLIMKDEMNDVSHRFTTGVSCKSWHGSLNKSDSYVPFVVSYPGGNKYELDTILNTVCPNNNCIGNWKLSDLVKEIIKTQYSGQ